MILLAPTPVDVGFGSSPDNLVGWAGLREGVVGVKTVQGDLVSPL